MPALPKLQPCSFLASAAEPALQRELRQRATAGRGGSCAAELIGFVERVPDEWLQAVRMIRYTFKEVD